MRPLPRALPRAPGQRQSPSVTASPWGRTLYSRTGVTPADSTECHNDQSVQSCPTCPTLRAWQCHHRVSPGLHALAELLQELGHLAAVLAVEGGQVQGGGEQGAGVEGQELGQGGALLLGTGGRRGHLQEPPQLAKGAGAVGRLPPPHTVVLLQQLGQATAAHLLHGRQQPLVQPADSSGRSQ